MPKWFHVTFSTYGAWLPGDARGFRAWRHKRHSSGDYKRRPPAGEHAALEQYARRTMKGRTITLTGRQREVCARAIVEKLSEKGCEVIAVAVGGQHVHIQVRVEDRNLRRVVGLAKQAASHRLRDDLPGTIWAARCRADPIRSREHQLKLFRYLVHHRRQGAFVWTMQDAR